MKTHIIAILTLALLAFWISPSRADEVVIKAGSKLSMHISGVPAEEMAAVGSLLTVSSEGKIKVTYLTAPIQAAGITPSQLQARIEAAYRAAEVFTEPTVQIQAADGQTTAVVSVGGEVRNPGDVPYRTGLTIFAVINAAGGPTEYADMGRVKLLRAGQERILDLRSVTVESNIEMKEGDGLYIPGG